MPVTLRSTIRQKPADGAKGRDGLETRTIEATGDDYDQAKAELDAQTPDGWQQLHITQA